MNVLVIGSGGREHAICRSFAKSSLITKLFCANGNAGIAKVAKCVPIRPDDIAGLLTFAIENEIQLTFVGGETPLALGIVDEFEANGIRIIGPSKGAARLEASKSFAKEFMASHGIPTAKFLTVHSRESAIRELDAGGFGNADTPVVVKADGLAAGKGVVVAANRAEAVAAIDEMADLVGYAAAETIVLEECLFGKEVSLLMFVDGEDFVLMPPTRDHKRLSEGDTGPNTGGMGAVTDSSFLSAGELKVIVDSIINPTLKGCVDLGFRFRGILFLGLMMVQTENGRRPMVIEYNVRFGDPETQAILVRLETDLVHICEVMLDSGQSLANLQIEWKPGSSACVVLAAEGYPHRPRSGDTIHGLESAKGVEIFHAGTAFCDDSEKEYCTSGGRVLGVTSIGADLNVALASAFAAVDKIRFDGMQFRRDIGK